MMIWNFILIILINFNIAKCQQSCSNIANYYSDSYGVYGQIEVANVPLQQQNFFEAELSVAARLPSSNDWKITLANANIYDDLLNRRSVTLNFFPLITNPLPTVTAVFLNGNRICSSPAARGSYVSTIKLSYTSTINNIPQHLLTSYRQNQNPSWYNQNQGTTRVSYVQPQTRPPQTWATQPPTYATQRQTWATQPPTRATASPRQTNAPSSIENKSGVIRYQQSFVCGVQRSQQSVVSFVVGGEDAKKSEFPWLAAFYYRGNGFICGGSLVSSRIIVTAAHCVQDKQNVEIKTAEDSTFYLGKHRLKDLDEKDYINTGVREFVVHPNWNPFDERYEADIAIAIVFRTIKFNNNIIPLCIPPQKYNHADIVHKTGLVAGWGLTETGSISEVPKYVSLPVVDDADCLRSNPAFAKITSKSTFCIGDGSGRSPCNGDSGGAFAVKNDADSKYYLRGVVSAGISRESKTCDSSQYSIFTDVAQYTNWIQQYISTYG